MDEVIGEIRLTISDSGIDVDTEFSFLELVAWLGIARDDLVAQFFERTRIKE